MHSPFMTYPTDSTNSSCSGYLCANTKLYLGRGEISGALHDGEAVDDYEKALQLDPANIEARLKCASGYLTIGTSMDYEKSREHAERAVSLEPDNFRCHLALATAMGLVGEIVVFPALGRSIRTIPDRTPVLEHYARAVELAPESPRVYRARGMFYRSIGDYPRALADLNRALELRPDDHFILCSRARVLMQLGEFDKALADFATYIQFRPHNEGAHAGIAQTHVRMGNWQSAVDSYTKALQINPSNFALLKRRAFAYVNLGQYAPALADLRRATGEGGRGGGTSALWWIPASQLARSPDDFRQGLLELADVVVERASKSAEAYASRGSLHKQLKDYERADADFAKAASLNPNRAHTWHGWGHAYMERGMKEEAREKYSKAIELNPGYWLFWSGRGRANFRLHDFEAAVNDFSRVLELHPAYDEASSLRTVAYIRSGRLDEARADLEQAISSAHSAEHHTHYRHALCWLMLEEASKYRDACAAMLGRFGETDDPMAANFTAWTCALAPDAVEDYEPVLALAAKAVDAQPDSDQFLNTLGAILYRAGRHDEAIERLTELDRRRETADGMVQSSPAYTWYFLAMAHQKAAGAEQAREYLEKANQSTDEALADEENPPRWNRRATLELLRKEAEALLGTDDPESAEGDHKAQEEE